MKFIDYFIMSYIQLYDINYTILITNLTQYRVVNSKKGVTPPGDANVSFYVKCCLCLILYVDSTLHYYNSLIKLCFNSNAEHSYRKCLRYY